MIRARQVIIECSRQKLSSQLQWPEALGAGTLWAVDKGLEGGVGIRTDQLPDSFVTFVLCSTVCVVLSLFE